MLDRLDAYRLVVDIEGAGGLAGGRADAAGELGKVVGAVQNINGVFPVAPKHQLIEIGNDVVDRAAAVTKRCAAIHAPRGLLLGLPVIKREDEFLVIFEPFWHGLVALLKPLEFHETSDFSHIFFLGGGAARSNDDRCMDSRVRGHDEVDVISGYDRGSTVVCQPT